MQIFEYPYIIITIFVMCFIVLAVVGAYFAVRGVKTANGKADNDFTTISRLEIAFEKLGKMRENRCAVYIDASVENYESLYSLPQAQTVFNEVRAILLATFAEDGEDTICPHGEDNFVALCKWDEQTAKAKIEACVEAINKCFIAHKALKVADIRFGVYFALGTQVTFDEAISRAKQACLLAQNENLAYVEWSMHRGKALEKKIKIENNIEHEIDNNRFFLEYQPVLDAKTKKIVGAEVLSRLNSESDGVLSPGSFLSAVDSVGLNDKFDYYIFEKNCKWIANDKKHREAYKYTINFSRATLCDANFAQNIIAIVEKYGLPFSCLAVEVLEDKEIKGEARARMIANLSALKQQGMSILLDDFGSGYTAYTDLQSLDISVVKVDKSITQNASTETGYIILQNIIRTAKDIGFMTLCEGVETAVQEAAAIRAGCDFLQGFYYYKPMPVAQLEKILNKERV